MPARVPSAPLTSAPSTPARSSKAAQFLGWALAFAGALSACSSDHEPLRADLEPAESVSLEQVTLCTRDGQACTASREAGTCVNGACCTGCVNSALIGTKLACAPGDTAALCGSGGAQCISCDDRNPCTQDTCTAKGCSHSPIDGACPGGVCVGSQCCTGCVDSNGVCQKGLSPDSCGRGGGKCDECFDRLPCTFDLCTDGACTYPAKPDNALCDADNDVCNGQNKCSGGKCLAGAPLNCEDNDPCTKNYCDPIAGCQKDYAEGTCNDGNPCTISDYCAEGVCKGGATATCNDNEVCTEDSCDPAGSGCKNRPINLGQACDDGSVCSSASACSAQGKCETTAGTACDDNNPCTVNNCTGNGVCYYTEFVAVDTPCVPAQDKCVVNAACDAAGMCSGGETKSCNDNNPCTEESCDPLTGECVSTKLNEGECNDGSICTENDTCQEGVCEGTPKDCPTVECFTTGKCDPDTGNCTYSPLSDGASCESETGTCSRGSCVLNPVDENTAGAGGVGGSTATPTEGGSPSGGQSAGGETSAAGDPGTGQGGSEPASGGRSGAAGTSTNTSGDRGAPFQREPGGCSCSVPGQAGTAEHRGSWALALGALSAVLVRRRRQPRAHA